MCLNKQILSAWIDNEIPSPWDQKIGTHIAACTSCQKAVKKYSHIKDVLHEPDIVASDSLERVWNRLEPVFVKKANKNLNRGSEKKQAGKEKFFTCLCMSSLQQQYCLSFLPDHFFPC